MESITQALTHIVGQAFAACGYDESLGQVTVSDRLDLGHFQCNGAFGGAKLHRKAPAMIAQDVIKNLEGNPAFAQVTFAPPGFINLTLGEEYLLSLLNPLAMGEGLFDTASRQGNTVVIDYGGPNVAKPLHIGHLRSAIIGQSLKNLARLVGYKVIGDVHLGDWGLQIGLVIAELACRNPGWPYFTEPFSAGDSLPALDVDTLNEIYPFASKKSKEDPEFKEAAGKATYDLQQGRPGYRALWREIMRVSVADLKANYEKLGIDFDVWYGESDADPFVEPMVDVLRAKNLLRESDGALVVDVAKDDDKVEMPPVIIKKSDNSNLYATTDLATIVQRVQDMQPSAIWYVVDSRQELHFTQVFRCARRAELLPAQTELEFVGFGTMNGSDGKPYKTRDGGIMRLSDLLDTITRAARERLQDSAYIQSLPQQDKDALARKVGVAAIKFGDLINYRQKDYIFQMDKFLSFEGKTGPYLLYMLTRIHSILKKLGIAYDEAMPLTGIYSQTETELLLKILSTGDVFLRALSEKAPNFICENAYQIASLFSRFYHDNHIMAEQDQQKKSAWIALILLVRRTLLLHLDVLGIEPVEHM